MTQTFRKIFIIGLTACLLLATGSIFWYQDWVYSLPTPKPAGMRQAAIGSFPALGRFNIRSGDDRPVLLHFMNPDCPCSKFNTDHIHTLLRRYGSRVRFLAVLQSEKPEQSIEAFRGFNLDMACVVDSLGVIADECGVYSTPQAVILDRTGKLAYRGNYNSSRYCSDPDSEFARIVLDSLVSYGTVPHFSSQATIAYGCRLFSDTTSTK